MAPAYDDYCDYLQNLNVINDFKQNQRYRCCLEHISQGEGEKYLELIETEFDIPFTNIVDFVTINDKYGGPLKDQFFSNKYKKIFNCSPTCLRYIYHALVILQYYKTTQLMEIVEVGCGYGGLCLAINYFSNLLEIPIRKYHLVDLPVVCNLITQYLSKHDNTIKIPYEIYVSDLFGENIASDNLFMISNYCFTEISDEYKNNYCRYLLPKVNHGFMVGQFSFCRHLSPNMLQKTIVKIEEEKPLTGEENCFVYF